MEINDKKRCANYTQREKENLLSLVEKYIKIIENKKTNVVFNKQKNQCWEKLAWEYNSTQTTGSRTGQQLKSCYEQIKKIAKQHKAEDKVELLKTGGGTFVPKITTMDEKVLLLLKDNYFFLDNQFDSNAISKVPSTLNENLNILPNQPSSSKENIYVIYEEENEDSQIEVDYYNNISNTTTEVETIETDMQEMNNNSSEPEFISSLLQPKKKRKIDPSPSPSQKALKKVSELSTKKLEAANLKIEVLTTMAETEKEHLKGAKIDNQIKELIKEKEMLDIKMKKIQLSLLSSKIN